MKFCDFVTIWIAIGWCLIRFKNWSVLKNENKYNQVKIDNEKRENRGKRKSSKEKQFLNWKSKNIFELLQSSIKTGKKLTSSIQKKNQVVK